MPKIRQAIAVLAAAAFCIAFNTYRYPVVRQMVSAGSVPAPTEAANSTEKGAAADQTWDGDDTASTGPSKRRAGTACKDGVCTMPLPDSPSASLKGSLETESGGRSLGYDERPFKTNRESSSAYGEPMTSSRSYDAAPSEPSTEEKAWPTESATKSDSKWKLPENGRSEPPQSNQAESSSANESAYPESHDSPAESSPEDTAAKHDLYSTSSYGSAAKSSLGKTAARLMSAVGGRSASSADSDNLPSTKDSLVPIARPAPRTKKSKAATGKAASDFRLLAEQGTKSEGVRHLPPVDSDFAADAPVLTPDLLRTYPATSAE